jgi:outer membrane biosynthesis protein TonB
MEATFMKALGVISTTALFLLFGATVPAFAQEEHHEEAAKPAKQEEQAKPAAKQEQAKPEKQEQQPKAAKQEEQAKPEKQEQAKPEKQQAAKPQKQEDKQAGSEQKQSKEQPGRQQQSGQGQQSQGQYAKNGQKDSYGHEYNESRFGPNHHARFEENGGRFNNGRREYSYGGYWFYAGAYPAWFYQQDVYFVLGADGLWYAVAYGNPSLTFQVNIE